MSEVEDKIKVSLKQILQIFLLYGYEKTSLEDIAKLVGTSCQSLYLFYKSKENLLKEIVLAFFK